MRSILSAGVDGTYHIVKRINDSLNQCFRHVEARRLINSARGDIVAYRNACLPLRLAVAMAIGGQ